MAQRPRGFQEPPFRVAPATGLVRAVDISTSRLTAASAQALRDLGYRKMVVGIRYADMPLTRSNLRIAADYGFDLDAYAYLYWGGNVASRVALSVELVSDYSVQRLWLDCEDNGDGAPGVPPAATFPPSRIVDLIGRARAACGQFPQGLYSSPWWWIPATGDSHLWAGAEWWDADYDGVADLSVFRPFGGVTRLRGKQFAGTTDLAGLSVDLSVFAA